MMSVYHYYATYQNQKVDGVATMEGEIKTMEHYNKLKESISDDYFGGVPSKYITLNSLSLLSK